MSLGACTACGVELTHKTWAPMIVQWTDLFPKKWDVCVPCIELKLGRRLAAEDLTHCFLNLAWKHKQRPDLLNEHEVVLLTHAGTNLPKERLTKAQLWWVWRSSGGGSMNEPQGSQERRAE